MNNIGTKTIETERCLLRKLTLNDSKTIFDNWAQDQEVTKYVAWSPHPNIETTKKLLEHWILEYEKPHTYRWGIELKETSELVSTIDVLSISFSRETCEVGFVLSKKVWGKGIMTEVLKEVINYLLNKADFYLIKLKHIEENVASGRVMEKNGMEKIAKLPNFAKMKDGSRSNLILYAINKEQFNLLQNNTQEV